MQIVKPKATLLIPEDEVLGGVERFIERIGRTCYKSEDKITEQSADQFIRDLVSRGHEAMIEHYYFVLDISEEIYIGILELVNEENGPGILKYINMSNDGNRALMSFSARGIKDLWRATCDPVVLYLIEFLRPTHQALFSDIPLPESFIFENDVKFLTHEEVRQLPKELAAIHTYYTIDFICDRGCCYDDQTKVLTQDGWKLFKDLTDQDVYYSLDDDNHLVKVKAKQIIFKDYTGNLHKYKTTQIDLAVTPNHNMWVYDYHKRSNETKTWKFIKSEDMTNNRYMFNKSCTLMYDAPLDAEDPEPRTFTIPSVKVHRGFYDKEYQSLTFTSAWFFELLGWWITDGSVSFGMNGSGNRVTISQTKPEGRQRIKMLLTLLELNYWSDDKEYRINSPQLFSWLVDNFIKQDNMKKSYYISLPRWIYTDLNPRLMNYLLDGIKGGDGSQHTGGSGYQIYTVSENLAEDIVELALNIGKAANIRYVDERKKEWSDGRISDCLPSFVVSVIETTEHLYNKTNESFVEEQYNGKVYCVELEDHHRLYVMRNGKACWCGNSHEIVRHRPCSFAQESTRYCNYSKDKFGNELTFIDMSAFGLWPDADEPLGLQYRLWRNALEATEKAYIALINSGAPAQLARSVLPNSLKTEIIVTANDPEWDHFFYLRDASSAHPSMQQVAKMAKKEVAFIKPW